MKAATGQFKDWEKEFDGLEDEISTGIYWNLVKEEFEHEHGPFVEWPDDIEDTPVVNSTGVSGDTSELAEHIF